MCNMTIFVFVIKAQLLTSADRGYILLLEQQVYLVLIEQFNANLISSQSLLPFITFYYLLDLLTAQKMKFSIKGFFSKCEKIRRKLRIWSHLLRKTLISRISRLLSPFQASIHFL